MIQFAALHHLLAASIADMVPVKVNLLLSEEAKRLARQGTTRALRSGGSAIEAPVTNEWMLSPWKVCRPRVLGFAKVFVEVWTVAGDFCWVEDIFFVTMLV